MIAQIISTADLMKKGLRRNSVFTFSLLVDFNRRPDEEGIKTTRNRSLISLGAISTADLMKKGLRQTGRCGPFKIMISTADLMKKGLRRLPYREAQAGCISTADLMKKGLRRTLYSSQASWMNFNRRPDEEGIKTCSRRAPCHNFLRFQPQT